MRHRRRDPRKKTKRLTLLQNRKRPSHHNNKYSSRHRPLEKIKARTTSRERTTTRDGTSLRKTMRTTSTFVMHMTITTLHLREAIMGKGDTATTRAHRHTRATTTRTTIIKAEAHPSPVQSSIKETRTLLTTVILKVTMGMDRLLRLGTGRHQSLQLQGTRDGR